ncbi:MAG TPA: hypothetical protein DHV42_03260 [Lachnospiraceae bacterium]|nr:hypothetical protein [Lachnospiraceae bacterium]
MERTMSGTPDESGRRNDSSSRKTSTRSSASRRNSRRRKNQRADSGRFMIARLLALVCMVLVVFEGNVIYRLFSHRVGTNVEIMNSQNTAETEGLLQNSADTDTAVSTKESTSTAGSNSSVLALAGGALAGGNSGLIEESATTSSSPVMDTAQSSEAINSPKVVPLQSVAVDDSHFRNAVFIGDSRMEGFRNSSGITQGTFLTSVGLAINDMDKAIIATANGKISVYQGLSGTQYDKIYLMLGANDLGYYPWDMFLPQFQSVLEQFHELQPKAIIYVCSVIYVDESKIAPGYEYDNNDNVRTINGYILEACENLWYSYYLNLNEIFSNGAGGLIAGAAPDGIHLYPEYLVMMLDYLKTHYITDETFAQAMAAHPDDIANAQPETEAAKNDGLIEEVSAG